MQKQIKWLVAILFAITVIFAMVGCVDEDTTPKHDYTFEVTKEATCTEEGEIVYTCKTCDESFTESIAKLAHTPVVDEAVAPTCTTAGKTEGKHCSACGETFVAQKEIAATGHTEVVDAAVAPTCTTAGKTEGKHCSTCNEVLVAQKDVSALGHKYESKVTAPTCLEGGYTTYTCSVCNDSYVADEVAAKGHFEKTLAAVAPTCTETGLTEGKQCTVCNTVTKAQETVNAKGHNEKTLAAVAPTCTATGLTEGKQCSVCNTVTVAQETVNAKGHTESAAVKENIVDSTCAKEGSYDSVVYCSVCGEELSRKTEAIAKKNHTVVTDAAVAPDCIDTGLTEGSHCSVCNEVLVAQTVVDALGHTEVVVAGKAATCTAAGLSDGKKCSVCNAELIKQEAISALGHTEQILPAVAATCTKEGKTEGKYCSECSEILVAQAVVGKLPHTYDDDSDLNCNVCNYKRDCLHPEDERILVPGKDATCTETGLEDGYKCNVCGEIVVAQEVIPAKGHTESKIAAKDPTCTEAGNTAGKKCIVCEAILEQPTVIEATGHTEKILAAVAPTCTANGLTEGKQCSVCKEILVAQNPVATIDHSYSETLINEGEYHYYKCVVCGVKKNESKHDFIETSRRDATCENAGAVYYACTCGAEKSEELAKLGHNFSTEWTRDVTGHWHVCTRENCNATDEKLTHNYNTEVEGTRVDATCAKDGSYKAECECGDVHEITIEAKGHNYESVETAPDCVNGGYTTHTCSVCNDTYKDSEVDALGHTEVVDVAVAPTCTATGLTEGKHCSVCDAILVAQTAIDATSHSYTDGICGTCGGTDPDYYFPVTIPEALEKDDGVQVEVSGTVSVIGTAWSEQYNNISVTIVDADGKELYVYRLATEVKLGDIITVKGVMATYNSNRQIAAGATAEITGHDTSYDEIEAVTTIPDALAAEDGVPAVITGTVVEINIAWSDSYGNITVTIADNNGYELYVYRLATNVGLGDVITVTGYVGSYNGAKQIAAGATATIDVAHGDNHTYEDGICTICGAEDPSVIPAEDKETYLFSEYEAGTQYASDEVHVLDDNTTVVTTAAHFTTQLRLYSSSTNNGYAIIKSLKTITKIAVNAGHKADTLVIYGSNDEGATWTKIGTIATTSTYADYTCDFDGAYNWLKLDVEGENQIRIASMTLTFCSHTFESEPTCSTSSVCTSCGTEIYAEHNVVVDEAVDATCGETGLTEGKHCSVCKEVIVAQEVISATGLHSFTDDNDEDCDVCGFKRVIGCQHTETNVLEAVAATCVLAGKTEGKQCANEDCLEILIAQEEIPATGVHTTLEQDALSNQDLVCDTCEELIVPAADSTLTVLQANVLGSRYESNTYTTDKYYIVGKISTTPTGSYGNTNIADEDGNPLYIYGLYSEDGTVRYDAMTIKPAVDDEIKIYAVIGSYNSKSQAKNAWVVECNVLHTCVYSDATCTAASACSLCGKIFAEKLEHTYGELVKKVDATCTEAGMNAYYYCEGCKGYFDENKVATTESALKISALGHTDSDADNICNNCGESMPSGEEKVVTTLATFEFGDNGDATHADGSTVSNAYEEIYGSYTLSLTNPDKVYSGARDAKGNSCLKLGASKAIGSLTINSIPDNVTKVIIYVAGYKANEGIVVVNGTEYTISTISDNGEYTAIEIDVSNIDQVIFETAASAKRCMINTIVFKGYAE